MRRLFACLMLLVLALPVVARAELPRGWILRGSDPSAYDVQLDSTVTHEGRTSARLASIKRPNGFGTMMQTVDARTYLGKRVRLTAWVRTRDVKQMASIWMRVDGPGAGNPSQLAFDNMYDRPLVGTTDWTPCSVVLDVPKEAVQVAFGCMVVGEGTAWFDDIRIEPVSRKIPSTDRSLRSTKPTNLDFER